MKAKKEIKNTTSFWVYASNNAENLYEGDCFENCLLNQLEDAKKYNLHKGMEILFDCIEKEDIHPQDTLDFIFMRDAIISYEFVEKINRLDIINSSCIEFETPEGIAMSVLLNYSDIKFIVHWKEWSKGSLNLALEAVHCDFEEKAIFKINSGAYV